MKTRNIILTFIALLALCSCQDMFEPADENTRQEDAMVNESKYAYGLLMYGYSRLPYKTTTQTDVATDDAVTNQTGDSYLNMANGAWASDNNPMSQWDACKDGIQYVNKFLTIVEKTKWALSAPTTQQMFVDRMKGEALGLRAIFYYHLLQAHAGYADDGELYGVPLLLEPEDAGSDFDQPRATFAECVKQCFADCDAAIELLPASYADIKESKDIPQKYEGATVTNFNLVLGNKSQGFVNATVVQAVKAQIALLAVSPAYRDKSGVTAEEAATICGASIKSFGGMSAFDPTGNVWYKNKTKLQPGSSEMPEILWRQDRSNDATQENDNFPPSLSGGGRINPTQNLVDAFPMSNGLPITDSRSGYDQSNPYANRDPRFEAAIIHNGMQFKNTIIMTGENMPNADNNTDDNLNSVSKSTRTGYYMCKLLREDAGPSAASASSSTKQYHIYPRIRATEIFLAYAEAANEAWGPTGDAKGIGFTAYDVIKAIRERAGLCQGMNGKETDVYLEECKASKEKMAELIRNERRLELCFENFRFWDLRRWQMPIDDAARGVRIVADASDATKLTYNYMHVEDRKFDKTYQYYGPIPRGEVLKWSKLQQNKGWK